MGASARSPGVRPGDPVAGGAANGQPGDGPNDGPCSGCLARRLRDPLDIGQCRFVFLRHVGCSFCRESIAELRRVSGQAPGLPRVLFFFQGSTTEGRVFPRRYRPEARGVFGPSLEFYDTFGVKRGGVLRPAPIPAVVR